MIAPVWSCVSCDHKEVFGERYRCPKCGGELSLEFDHEALAAIPGFHNEWGIGTSIWQRFGPLLPPADPSAAVSLGEGGTPLVHAKRLGQHLGLDQLYFKLEMCNPTGSFKDRQIAIALTKGLEWGYTAFGTASSGNVGVSLAAFCAKSGTQANVWVPRGTPKGKLAQIQVYGAKLFMLPDPSETGDMASYFRVFTEMPAFCASHDMMPMVTARPANPLIVEGAKTAAFEIHLQLGYVPDTVILPVAGGGLCGGTWKGFEELRRCGLTSKLPVLLGAQDGSEKHLRLDQYDDSSIDRSSLYVPLDGDWARQSLASSQGTYLGMMRERASEAQELLAHYEGIAAEPQGAIATAGLLEAADRRLLSRDETVVVYITGHGLKDQQSLCRVKKASEEEDCVAVDSLRSSSKYFSQVDGRT